MLRFLMLIVLGVATIAGLAAAYGSSLPREHVVASRVVISQPIEQVFSVVRNPATLVGSWADLTRAERVAGPAGRETWEETVAGDAMRITVSEVRPPVRMVTTIEAAPDAAFGGRWTYDLEAVPGGTQVTVTEAGWIGNPLFRVMGRVFGLHASIEGYLKGLGQHFTQGVRPERVGQ